MATEKGLFIVLDGGEGSGKSELLKRIKECYGNSVLITREPGGSALAEEIRQIIKYSPNAKQADAMTMLFLFWAARADHMKNTVIPALKRGINVVSDRLDSSIVYQLTDGNKRELLELFWILRRVVLGEYVPDIYVYMDVTPEVGIARKTNQKEVRKDHYDDREIEFHENVRMGFKEFFAHNDGIKSVTINADNPQDDVWKEFKQIITSLTTK